MMAETQSTGQQVSAEGEQKKGRFEPKVPVHLNPPKSDPISKEYLAKCNGTFSFPVHIEFPPSALLELDLSFRGQSSN